MTASIAKIDAAQLDKLREIKDLTGISIKHSITEALDDYLSNVIPPRMEQYQARAAKA